MSKPIPASLAVILTLMVWLIGNASDELNKGFANPSGTKTDTCTPAHKLAIEFIEASNKQAFLKGIRKSQLKGAKSYCRVIDFGDDKFGVSPIAVLLRSIHINPPVKDELPYYNQMLDIFINEGADLDRVQIRNWRNMLNGEVNQSFSSAMQIYSKLENWKQIDTEKLIFNRITNSSVASSTVLDITLFHPAFDSTWKTLADRFDSNKRQEIQNTLSNLQKFIDFMNEKHSNRRSDDEFEVFLKKLEYLLENGADPNLSYGYMTPLYQVLGMSIETNRRKEIAKLLLDFGADPNLEFTYPNLLLAQIRFHEPLPVYSLIQNFIWGESYIVDNSENKIPNSAFIDLIEWIISEGAAYDEQAVTHLIKVNRDFARLSGNIDEESENVPERLAVVETALSQW